MNLMPEVNYLIINNYGEPVFSSTCFVCCSDLDHTQSRCSHQEHLRYVLLESRRSDEYRNQNQVSQWNNWLTLLECNMVTLVEVLRHFSLETLATMQSNLEDRRNGLTLRDTPNHYGFSRRKKSTTKGAYIFTFLTDSFSFRVDRSVWFACFI